MKKVLVMLLMSTLGLTQTMADNNTMVKKFLNVATATSETRASAFSGGTGSETDPYLISTPEDLQQLSKDVNSAEPYNGKYFSMTNDIDMSDITDFTPIGNNLGKNDGTMFMGVFNGNNNTISNLNISYENKGKYYQGVALFGIVMDATIKNLRIDKSSFLSYGMVSSIAAVSFGATIQNCHVGKDVAVTAEKLGAGGIIAFSMMKPSIIEDCSSAATVVAHFEKGGVAGGIMACVSEQGNGTTIRRCVNYGSVTSDADFCSGILPMIETSAIVEDCANFGYIKSERGGTGIAYFGIDSQNKDALVVKNSYNVGEVNCFDLDYVDAVCLGNVFSSEGNVSENCVVENCFFAEDTKDAKSVTSTAMQSADMKTEDFVAKLNNGRENGPWCFIEGVADGFPVPFAGLVPSSIKDVEASAAAISFNAGVATVAGVKAGDKFAVVDMAGRTVKMAVAQNNGNLTIDMTNLPAGVYAIGNGSISKKIVK